MASLGTRHPGRVPAFLGTLAFGLLAKDHVPDELGLVVVLCGAALTLAGLLMTFASLPALMIQHYSLFNGRSDDVMRAFARDLVSVHKPVPPTDPPWPPPMRSSK